MLRHREGLELFRVLSQHARGRAQTRESPQLPQVTAEEGPEIPERDARGLVGFTESRHGLDHAVANRVAGQVRVDVTVNVAPGAGDETHEDVHGRSRDRIPGDTLHLSDGSDGDQLLEGKVAILTRTAPNTVVRTSHLEAHVHGILDPNEATGDLCRVAAEMGHADGPEFGRLEPDHGSRNDATHAKVGRAAQNIEKASMDRGCGDLADQPGGDVAVRSGLVVGVRDVHSHSTRSDSSDVDPDDALGDELLDHAEDVLADRVDDVATTARDRGDVHTVDHRDRIVARDEGGHVVAVEDVHLLSDLVVDPVDPLQGFTPIDHDWHELWKGNGLECATHGRAHQTGTSENKHPSGTHSSHLRMRVDIQVFDPTQY